MENVSRRSFVAGGAAALALGAAGIVGMTQSAQAKIPSNASSEAGVSTYPTSIDDDPYFAKPDPITDISASYDYDIIVIGAGCSGVPAACSAADNGAKVAVLQKSPRVYSHGSRQCAWNAPFLVEAKGKEADEDTINALKAEFVELSGFGTQTGLLNKFFDEVPVAMQWQYEELTKVGESIEFAGATSDDPTDFSYRVVNQLSRAYAAVAEDYSDKVDFYFSTPALQLTQDTDGTVTGAIAQNRDGEYLQFNASKGVIIATGGYGANKELIARWMPECITMPNGCYPEDNTGDGALMAIWAGADVAPLKSKKIDIRFYGTHAARTNLEKVAFLMVNDKGKRLGNENADEMKQNDFIVKDPSADGTYYCIFDANYAEMLTAAGEDRAIPSDEEMAEYKAGTMPLVWEADTLEELAEKIGVPADNLIATCEHYGELCDAGYDSDFYKEPEYLYHIDTAPYYAMVRQYTIGGTLGVLKVDDNCAAINRTTGEPIPGLYIVGNDMGGLQTGQNYVWHDYGLSITSGTTIGYAVGRDLALS